MTGEAKRGEPTLTAPQRRAAEAVAAGSVRRSFPWTGAGKPRLELPPGISAGPVNRLVDMGLVRWRVDRLHGLSVHIAELSETGRRALGGTP